jgi:hypothetical protein
LIVQDDDDEHNNDEPRIIPNPSLPNRKPKPRKDHTPSLPHHQPDDPNAADQTLFPPASPTTTTTTTKPLCPEITRLFLLQGTAGRFVGGEEPGLTEMGLGRLALRFERRGSSMECQFGASGALGSQSLMGNMRSFFELATVV